MLTGSRLHYVRRDAQNADLKLERLLRNPAAVQRDATPCANSSAETFPVESSTNSEFRTSSERETHLSLCKQELPAVFPLPVVCSC